MTGSGKRRICAETDGSLCRHLHLLNLTVSSSAISFHSLPLFSFFFPFLPVHVFCLFFIILLLILVSFLSLCLLPFCAFFFSAPCACLSLLACTCFSLALTLLSLFVAITVCHCFTGHLPLPITIANLISHVFALYLSPSAICQ